MVNFETAPNKTARINLDTNAKLEPRSTLNVAFSTADQDTAILKFIVTQDSKPLYLGEANIESNIYLKHSNGSHISHPLTITDGLNGELSFQLPNDFGKIPGQVTAQVYVARKGEKQAAVAERIFSFTIEKSLAWEFDSETKLAYIVEFNELRERILNRQKEIEDAMANAEDYVTQLEQAREKGLSDIEIAKANSLEELNDLANTRLQEINNKGTEYLDSLDNTQNEIDKKIAQFNSDVDAGEYVKESNTESWQKSKITSDNGHVQSINTIDFNEIDNTLNRSGFYYVKNVINGPEGDYQTEGNIILYKFDNNKDRLNYQPRSSNKIFTKYKYGENSIWSDWHDLTYDMETTEGSQTKATQTLTDAKTYIDEQVYDTGWQPLTVMSNVSKHDGAGESMYRIVNDVCEMRFNIGIDKWTNELPIIQPPANAKPTSSFSFLARTNGNPGKNPAIISYDRNKGYFKLWTNGDNTINSGDYIYGHVVYMVGGALNV
ncbi:BppU family phage baseplate upper protein [Staphylococcus carnosus]|uniref:BppU family phage baseplate upper protein n=1 Tax=Staphylococcus carnosus TaxID=1281 RepID=UPI00081A51BB|nr:BppU family phage baseplate upper protein [Staphylococcus carnosus]ANZ33079.1 hypothetical protein BEK99_04360 [Staphylococcus carnosus]UTB85218.1 hypothetical protein A2I66_05965 [Staphylococcus carnosus]